MDTTTRTTATESDREKAATYYARSHWSGTAATIDPPTMPKGIVEAFLVDAGWRRANSVWYTPDGDTYYEDLGIAFRIEITAQAAHVDTAINEPTDTQAAISMATEFVASQTPRLEAIRIAMENFPDADRVTVEEAV
jgi:hypothetical protein